jgi:hypothetical protein
MIAQSQQKSGKGLFSQRSGFGVVKVLITFASAILLIGLFGLFLPPVTRSREVARRSQCKNNLKQIALALLNYESHYHALPPAYTVNENGKPLHSWRTLILPWMDQKALYDKIDLTKAWDDPVNAVALKTKISAYQCPSAVLPESHTTYMAIVTSNSCFQATEPRLLSDIKDGSSKTLMLIEVDAEHAVHWMSPRDADEALLLSVIPNGKHAHVGGTHAVLVDGSVRFVYKTLSLDVLRSIISISGGEIQEF